MLDSTIPNINVCNLRFFDAFLMIMILTKKSTLGHGIIPIFNMLFPIFVLNSVKRKKYFLLRLDITKTMGRLVIEAPYFGNESSAN